jgi:hypothetical protein
MEKRDRPESAPQMANGKAKHVCEMEQKTCNSLSRKDLQKCG